MGSTPIGSVYIVWSFSSDGIETSHGIVSRIMSLAALCVAMGEIFALEESLPASEDESEQREAVDGAPAITADRLSFSYTEGTLAVKDLSFSINKGETIALIGENGCGKSTLVKLILGLYQPSSGSLTIYGNEAFESGSRYIGRYVSAAFQDFCRFPFSLRENILFGNVEGEISDTEISHLMSSIHAEKILSDVQDPSTFLGVTLTEDGKELSDGEWQKVAIARALYGNKDIMIFDEPMAKLDALAEASIYEELRKRYQDKALILISHRIGFARNADRIFFMDHGEIVESGTHDELMELQGGYYRMFNQQKDMLLIP